MRAKVYISPMKKKKTYILAAALLLTAVILYYRITWYEVASLRVNDYTVTLEKLPPEHDGLVLAVIGDLHVRRMNFENGLYEAVEQALRERKPDLVLLLGDYVSPKDSGSWLEVDNFGRAVSKWHGQYGTLASIGNHDVSLEEDGRWPRVKEMLEQAGITILDGTGMAPVINGKPFQIVGFGDRDSTWSRMDRIPDSFDKSLPVYGMLHDPEGVFSIRNTVMDMIFSAHTHRGQLRLPVFGERYLVLRFREGWRGSGLRKHRNCTQFITSGIGTSAWPLRLYNLPEVAFVTLRCPEFTR